MSAQRFSQSNNTYMSKSYDGQEWNANFAHMLNRTRENINRIYSRYDDENADIRSIERSLSSPMRQIKSVGGQSLVNCDGNKRTLRTTTPFRESAESGSAANNIVDLLLARVAKLEQNGNQISADVSDERLSTLEETVRNLSKAVDGLTNSVREHQSSIIKITHQHQSYDTAIDILQHDNNVRRGVLSKFEAWVRGNEQWRDDVELRIDEICKQFKVHERRVHDNKSSANEFATKMDLADLKNQMHVTTQQSVVASLTAWHDKIENNVRFLERQMAAMRIGASSNVTLTDEQVKEAFLTSSQPSELLVRGVVNTELRSLESALEDKIHARALSAVKSEIYEQFKEVKAEAKVFLQQLAPPAEVDPPHSEKRKVSVAEVSLVNDRQMNSWLKLLMIFRVDNLNHALSTLQDAINANEKNYMNELRTLERRIDSCSTVVESYSVMTQQHRSEISSALLMLEERTANKANQLRNEISGQLHDLNEKIGVDRVAAERRLTLIEHMVADLVEKVELSKSIVESHLTTSPEVIKLQTAWQACASKLETVTSGLSSLKTVFADYQTMVASRFDQFSGRKEEITELRERLVVVEQAANGMPGLSRSLTKIEGEVLVLQNQCNELHTQSVSSREALRDTTHCINGIDDRLENTVKSIATLQESVTKQFSFHLHDKLSGINAVMEKVQLQVQQLTQITHAGEGLSQSLKGGIAMCQKDCDALKTSHAALTSDIQSISRDVAKLGFNMEKSASNTNDWTRHFSFVDRRLKAAETRLELLEQTIKTPIRRSTMYYDVEDDGNGENNTSRPQRRQTAYFDLDVDEDEKLNEKRRQEDTSDMSLVSSVPFSAASSDIPLCTKVIDISEPVQVSDTPIMDDDPDNASKSKESPETLSVNEKECSDVNDKIINPDDASSKSPNIYSGDEESSHGSLSTLEENMEVSDELSVQDNVHITETAEAEKENNIQQEIGVVQENAENLSFDDDDVPDVQVEIVETGEHTTDTFVACSTMSRANEFMEEIRTEDDIEQHTSAMDSTIETVNTTFHSVEHDDDVNKSTSVANVQISPSAKSEVSQMYDVDSASDWDEASDARSDDVNDDEITAADDAMMSSDFTEEKVCAFMTTTRDDSDVEEAIKAESTPMIVSSEPLSFREKLRIRQEQLRNADIKQTTTAVYMDDAGSDFSALADDDDDDDIMHDISDASSSDDECPSATSDKAAAELQHTHQPEYSHEDDSIVPSDTAPRAALGAPTAVATRFGARDLLNDDDVSDFDDEDIEQEDLVMSFDDSFDA